MDKPKPQPKPKTPPPKLTPAEIEAGENEATYPAEPPSEEVRKSLMPKPKPAKKGYKSGGYVSKADGCVSKGRTKGRFV